MQILGIVGYSFLVFLAFVWIVSVRTKLGFENSTIAGSVFFPIAAIVIPLTKTAFIHSWWIIVVGYVLIAVAGKIEAERIPVLEPMLQFIAAIWGGLVRVGISPEQIHEAKRAAWAKHLGLTE